MNLFNYIRNKKTLPKVYLYMVELKNGSDHFVKCGLTKFIELKYLTFKKFGYSTTEIEVMQFPCKNDAIDGLKLIEKQLENYKYVPAHLFPEPENCYKIDILDGLNLREELPMQEKMQDDAIEMQVMQLLETKKPGKVAEELNIPAYKVSRIKKKYDITQRNQNLR